MTALQVATDVSRHLSRWTAEPGHDADRDAYLSCQGARVHVRLERRYGAAHGAEPQRVEFVACPPRLSNGQSLSTTTPWPRISVAISRGAESIANDVRRRLLVPFLEMLVPAREETRQVEDAGQEARLVADRLAAVVGGERYTGGWRDRGPLSEVHVNAQLDTLYRLRVSPGCGSNEVRVSFEVTGLDPETAAEVLQTIKAAKARRERAVRVELEPAESGVELLDEDHIEKRSMAAERATA